MNRLRNNLLLDVFHLLADHYGPMHWWPGESPFEVCVGAILTQNTAWTNVEKAIAALKQAAALSPEAIRALDPSLLAQLIRPSGFFTVKSRRLKSFVEWLFSRYQGSLDRMFHDDWETLRTELLQVHGIGPETCDAILLYAGGKPTFVVDAYTQRLLERLGALEGGRGYEEVRGAFMRNLPAEAELFNEYHALIVEHGKRFCRKLPRCSGCPLARLCRRYS